MKTTSLLAIVLLAACAGPTPATRRPTNLSAEDHRIVARDLRIRAWKHQPGGTGPSEYRSTFDDDGQLAEAQAHERAAEKLESNHRAACARVAFGAENVSPIARHVEAVEEVPDGVRVHLGHTRATAAEMMQQLRCHRAWLARYGANLSPDEPLGLAEVYLEMWRVDDGFELVLTARHATDVAELRRRAQALYTRRLDPLTR